MQRSLVTIILALWISSTHASVNQLQVTVGGDGFVYSPNTVQASIGDLIQFVVVGVSAPILPRGAYPVGP